MQATRPSGSKTTGFYRTGERSEADSPFEVTPKKCQKYSRPPSGRDPSNAEKRGSWQLQEEYLAGRLGKSAEENSRLWNTAKWIDRLIRTATLPAKAVKSLNLYADNRQDVFSADYEDEWADPDEKNEGFGFTRVKVYEQKELRALNLSDYDLVRLADSIEESDKIAAIDVDKLVRNTDPLPDRVDLPGSIERQEAIKIVRILMMGARSLWHPVKSSIIDHATMKSLGKTQGVGDGVAAAVGRTRVIEGMRIAESIRKRLTRPEHVAAEETHWPAKQAQRRHMAFMDVFISEILAAVTNKPLAANDNLPTRAVVSDAA